MSPNCEEILGLIYSDLSMRCHQFPVWTDNQADFHSGLRIQCRKKAFISSAWVCVCACACVYFELLWLFGSGTRPAPPGHSDQSQLPRSLLPWIKIQEGNTKTECEGKKKEWGGHLKDNKNLRHITNLAKRQKLLKETLMMLICFMKITAMFSKIFTLVLLKSVHEEFSNVTYNKTAQLPTRSTVIIMYRRYMKPCHIFLNEVFSFFLFILSRWHMVQGLSFTIWGKRVSGLYKLVKGLALAPCFKQWIK